MERYIPNYFGNHAKIHFSTLPIDLVVESCGIESGIVWCICQILHKVRKQKHTDDSKRLKSRSKTDLKGALSNKASKKCLFFTLMLFFHSFIIHYISFQITLFFNKTYLTQRSEILFDSMNIRVGGGKSPIVYVKTVSGF